MASWTDEYREIVEFYYWEPQHIGRGSGGKRFSGADEMYAHVNTLEVSLNHILNIFFSLYPLHKVSCFDDADESHTMLSAWELETYQRQQKNATQPDLFFVGGTSNVAVELKLGSKTNLEQVAKYVRFHEAITPEQHKPLSLYFLTPHSDPSKLFQEHYAGHQEVAASLGAAGINPPTIHFITYADFVASLHAIQTRNVTERRLIDGTIAYLAARL